LDQYIPIVDIDKELEGIDEPTRLRFACACCRRVWHWMEDARSRHAVEVAERFVLEEAERDELLAANGMAEAAYREAARKLWEAEIPANFTWTTDYCAIETSCWAACGALYCLRGAIAEYGPFGWHQSFESDHFSAHYWTSAAVASNERAVALTENNDGSNRNICMKEMRTIAEAARRTEMIEQSALLKRFLAERQEAP
jgi:hypothetical protein